VSPLGLVPLFFVLAVVAPAAWALAKVYLRSRRPRQVTCPHAQHFATVALDARHAVRMYALGEPDLRVKTCTLWPERRHCPQDCLRPAP